MTVKRKSNVGGRVRRRGTAARQAVSAKLCSVRHCGRRAYARGLCQTHHRQLLKTGKIGTIRPYRPRSSDTVKFAGLRLTLTCARKLERYAERHGIARGAAIADILEAWNARKKRKEE